MSDSGGPVELGEQLAGDFVEAVQQAAPMELPGLVEQHVTSLGMNRAWIYLVDIEQRLLHSLSDGQPQSVDGSLAGWAYRTFQLRVSEDADSGQLIAWLPLVDSSERLGVLGVQGGRLDPNVLARCRSLAAVLAVQITSKRAFSDTYARKTRTRAMGVSAEMLRAFLPVHTLGTADVVSAAVLEPAYQLGGDAFDHSLVSGTLHVSILDAMGHDLASGLTSALALSGCRSARRDGADLPELARTVDQALTTWFPDRFCTGVFAHLDLAGGKLRWINCGHPAPLLIRRHRLVHEALDRSPEPPLGMPSALAAGDYTVHEIDLEPGDRVLFYTDGVTEARGLKGEVFGLERFTDFIIRATAAGEPAPEVLRRLVHAILGHQGSALNDDATILMFEWRPDASA